MTMQSENKGHGLKGHGLADNIAAQMTLLGVAVAVLLVIAWFYIW